MKKGERFTLKQLKEDMVGMPFGKKVEHIWLNFKEYLIVGGFLLAVVIMLLVSFFGIRKQTVISGYLLNVDPSDSGLYYISEGYFAAQGGNELTQEYLLTTGRYVTEGTHQEIEISSNNYLRVLSLVAGEKLDYLLTDEPGLSVYIKDEIFIDLREFFTEEELAQWEGKLIFAQAEGEDPYPIAFDLSATDFVKSCLPEGAECFLAFTATEDRKDICRNFLQYILAYRP